MTTINPNTFTGANEGNSEGYIPHTTIESAKVDSDLLKIKHDLDYHLSLFQQAFLKLDDIDPADIGDMTAAEIVAAINASTEKIDADNLQDIVITVQKLIDNLQIHCNTTTPGEMHYEHSIKPTGLTYSSTPTSLITVCNNLLDELKNIRYQINKLNGKNTWIDTPDTNLTELKNLYTSTDSGLTAHKADYSVHLTAAQNAALDAAHSPSASNPVATLNDVAGHGNGDMLKAVYDKNNNGIVDSACALADACDGNKLKTWADITSKIASDIAAHKSNASAHHARYTDAEAIGAINNDTDHDTTATHRYSALIGKPAADAFSTSQVTNLRANKLADGTTPWTTPFTINPATLPNCMPMPDQWCCESEHVISKTYFSSTTAGTVESTIVGPAVLIGGLGVKTEANGVLQVSVNGGSTWVDVNTSTNILFGPDPQGDETRIWTCPCMYIQSGRSFKIRAGTTFSGCSDRIFGAGYHIQYKEL